MEIAVVGATAVVRLEAGSSAMPASPSPRSPRRSGGSPWPRLRSSGRTAGRPPPPRPGAWRPRRRRRSPTFARRSTIAGPWRPSSSVARSARPSRELAARASRSRPAPAPSERVDHALSRDAPVNAVELPGGDRGRPDAAVRAARRARTDRQQGGLRRLRVRRVHGPARRPAGEFVLVPRHAGRGPRVTTVEGLAAGRDAPPAPAGLPRAGRGPVRVLHAGDADQRDARCWRATPTRPTTRSGPGCPATSAAAPATSGSWPPSARRRASLLRDAAERVCSLVQVQVTDVASPPAC